MMSSSRITSIVLFNALLLPSVKWLSAGKS